MKNYTEKDLVYFAGFFDGEGSIGIYKDNRNDSYSSAFFVTNTNIEVLKWIKNRFGGIILFHGEKGRVIGYGSKGVIHKSTKDSYRWKLDVHNVKSLLPDLIPHLMVKKQEAITMLEYLTKMRTDFTCGGRPSWYRKWQEELYLKIRELKHEEIESEELEEEQDHVQLNLSDY